LKKDRLAVIWLSADKRAAADMAFLYIRTSLLNRWWKSCELILWGPSVDSTASDDDIQTELLMLKNIGAEIKVCEACALRYGVSAKLKQLGFSVEGMSEHLTELLQDDIPTMII